MNERVPHHRVVPGVLMDAQTSASRSHTSVQTLGCARVAMHQSQRTAELEGNGYSTTVSAEGNRLMNERASHHRVVPGVRRDAQTSASRSHTSVQTLGCARVAMHQSAHSTSSRVSVIRLRCRLRGTA